MFEPGDRVNVEGEGPGTVTREDPLVDEGWGSVFVRIDADGVEVAAGPEQTTALTETHEPTYVTVLGYRRRVCAECGADWPCPGFAKATCERLDLHTTTGCTCGHHVDGEATS
jgi:hypothetical protein